MGGGGQVIRRKRGGQRHKPSFSLTPAQVLKACRKDGHCDMCAGKVLALRACMERLDWNISDLAENSHVSRPMISEMLAMKTIGTTDTWNPLAESVGLELWAFLLLAKFCLLEQLSP